MTTGELQLKIQLAKAGLASDAAAAARQIEAALGGVEANVDLKLDDRAIKAAERAISEIAEESLEAARVAKQLAEAYGFSDQELDKVARQVQKVVAENRRATEEADRLEQEFKTLAKNAGEIDLNLSADPAQAQRLQQAVQRVAEETVRAKAEAEELKRAYNLSDSQVREVQRALRDLDKEAEAAKKSSLGLQSVLQGIGQGVGQAIAGLASNLAGGLKNLVGESLRQFGDFDAALTSFSAKSGIARDDLGSLEEEAVRLAAVTSQTPASVAQLSTALLSLGTAAGDVEKNLEGITKLSDLVGEDPVLTGQIVQTGLNIFGKFGETSDTLTDKLNALINSTATGSQQGLREFFQLFSDAAPIAASAGVGFDELSASFATLRDNGLPASVASTGLKNALLSLASPTAAAKAELESLGVSFEQFTDAQGNLDFSALLEGLSVSLAGITDKDVKLQKLAAIFGREAAPAVATLAENTERLSVNLQAVGNSAGSVDAGLEVLNQSFQRQLLLLEGRISGVLTQFGAALAPLGGAIVGTVNEIFGAIENSAGGFDLLFEPLALAGERLQEALRENPELVQQLAATLTTLGESLVGLAAGAIDSFSGAIASGSQLFESLGGMVRQFIETLTSVLAVAGQIVGGLIQVFAPVGVVILEIQARISAVLEAVAEAAGRLVSEVQGIFGTLFSGVDLGGAFEQFQGALDAIFAVITRLQTALLNLIAGALTRFREFLESNPQAVERFQRILQKLGEAFGKLAQIVQLVAGAVFSTLGDLFSSATRDGGLLTGVFEKLGPIVNLALRAIEGLLGAIVGFLSFTIERVAALVEGFEEVRRTILGIKIAAEDGVGSGLAAGLENATNALGEAGKALEETGAAATQLGEDFSAAGDEVESAVEKEEEALKRLQAANAEATSAILQSQQQRIAGVKEAQLAGELTAQEAADRIAAIEADSLADTLAARETELAEVRRLRDQGTLSAEQAAERERQLVEEIGSLNLQRLDAEIEAQERAKQAALAAREAEIGAAQSAASQQSQLLAAQQSLGEALATLEQERLKTQLAQAEASGDEAAAAQIRAQIKAAEVAQEEKTFQLKRQALELQIQQNRLEAELALIRAQANGASEQEITNLRRQIALVDELANLQRKQLGAEQQIARERRQQAEIQERAQAKQQGASEKVPSPRVTAPAAAPPPSAPRAATTPAGSGGDEPRRGTNFQSVAGRYFIDGQEVSLEQYREGVAPAGGGSIAAPNIEPSAPPIVPTPNPSVQAGAAALESAEVSTAAAPSGDFAVPIVAKLDELIATLVALEGQPRAISVTSPDPVADVGKILDALAGQDRRLALT